MKGYVIKEIDKERYYDGCKMGVSRMTGEQIKLKPISDTQRSCLECYYGSQLLGGYPAWCLHTGNKIHELVGCELWKNNKDVKE